MGVPCLDGCRIGSEEKGGAWCPRQAISKDVYEYLQIDLGKLMVITKVETQGRFGNGQVREGELLFFRVFVSCLCLLLRVVLR